MAKNKVALLILCFLVGSNADDFVNIDDVVDDLLDFGRMALFASDENTIKIMDLDKSFERPIFKKMTLKGEFMATNGTFGDLSTLYRTGDVFMETVGSKMILTASMGFDLLQVAFANYSFHLNSFHSSGSIVATSTFNSISAMITVETWGEKNCTVSVDKVSIDALGNFDIEITGASIWNKIGSTLVTWILNHFNENVKDVVNSKLQTMLHNALPNVDFCAHLPIPPPL